MAALILIYVDLNVIHRILVLTRMFGSRHNVTLIGDMIERFWKFCMDLNFKYQVFSSVFAMMDTFGLYLISKSLCLLTI